MPTDSLGLNPLYLGAIFRAQTFYWPNFGMCVLIPYISGLSFGLLLQANF